MAPPQPVAAPAGEVVPAGGPSLLPPVLGRRRSVRRLADGPLPPGALEALAEAVERTPAAYGVPPWRVVLLRERRREFWALVEAAFRGGVEGDRLARYLDRLAGFAGASVVALVYEDAAAADRLRAAWSLPEETAAAFVQQALGMVQFALWLAATDVGLGASLQHWEELVADPLAAFTGLARERFRLTAVMPIGLPADPAPPPRPERPPSVAVDGWPW